MPEAPAENGPRITRIKANAFDSAAFDDRRLQTYTWGSFGQLRLQDEYTGTKLIQATPLLLDLQLMQQDGKMFGAGELDEFHGSNPTRIRRYAVRPDREGHLSIPGEDGRFKKIRKISMLKSIDWGLNHCAFVDDSNRVYAMGQNRNGKVGAGDQLQIEDSDRSHSDPFDSEEEREKYRIETENRDKLVQDLIKNVDALSGSSHKRIASNQSIESPKRQNIDPISALHLKNNFKKFQRVRQSMP